jgi:hypothetical protein
LAAVFAAVLALIFGVVLTEGAWLVDAEPRALGVLVDDEVAAQHGQVLVGAGHPGVGGTAVVGGDLAGTERLTGTAVHRTGVRCDGGQSSFRDGGTGLRGRRRGGSGGSGLLDHRGKRGGQHGGCDSPCTSPHNRSFLGSFWDGRGDSPEKARYVGPVTATVVIEDRIR